MPLCAVLTCKSRTNGPEGPTKGLRFHRFPADAEVKRKWVDMTGRDNWSPTSTSVVCSKHFRDTDYIIKRSGNRYLKTAAIPCEYVVYRHLFPDEDTIPSPVSQTSDDRETASLSSSTSTSSRTQSPLPSVPPVFSLSPTQETQEADTTSYSEDFNDMNDNTIGWDQFQNLRYFGHEDTTSIRRRRRSEVDSSVPAEPDHSISKMRRTGVIPPLNFSPALDATSSSIEEAHSTLMEPSQSIAMIRKVVSKRKASKKTSSTTATAAAREAQAIRLELEAGNMNDLEKADSIIELQHKQLIHATVNSRKDDIMFNEIEEILRNTK